MSQPLLKRLYAWFRCRCIAARAPAGVVRGDRLQHRAVLGHRRRPQLRRVVVVLQLLVQRARSRSSHSIFTTAHQRAVAGRLGDAQVEQPVAGERLLLVLEFALHLLAAPPRSPAICAFFADFAASAAHSLSIM